MTSTVVAGSVPESWEWIPGPPPIARFARLDLRDQIDDLEVMINRQSSDLTAELRSVLVAGAALGRIALAFEGGGTLPRGVTYADVRRRERHWRRAARVIRGLRTLAKVSTMEVGDIRPTPVEHCALIGNDAIDLDVALVNAGPEAQGACRTLISAIRRYTG